MGLARARSWRCRAGTHATSSCASKVRSPIPPIQRRRTSGSRRTDSRRTLDTYRCRRRMSASAVCEFGPTRRLPRGDRRSKSDIVDQRRLEHNSYGHGTVNYNACAIGCSDGQRTGRTVPIVYDESGLPSSVPRPHVARRSPTATTYPAHVRARTTRPATRVAALARREWVHVELDLGRRSSPTHSEDQHHAAWAGSCCTNCAISTPPTRTRSSTLRSSATGWARSSTHCVASISTGGVEHAVLPLLYARSGHKGSSIWVCVVM